MLADLLARRGLTGQDTEAFVFTRPDGELMTYDWFTRHVWRPAIRDAGDSFIKFSSSGNSNARGLPSYLLKTLHLRRIPALNHVLFAEDL